MFVYRRYSPSDFRRVKALISSGSSDYEIASALKIPRSTAQNWRLRDIPPRTLKPAPRVWRPSDGAAYSYLLGIYLGDGHIVGASRLDIYMDASYPAVVEEVERTIATAYPTSHTRRDSRPGSIRIVGSGVDWSKAIPQHGAGKKHERSIELVDWQRALTEENPEAFIRGLIHSDGCRCVNEFRTRLPSGRVASYSYPRYFFSNLSADIRRLFTDHCEQIGIRWTQSNHRNISISHRASVATLDEFVGPKS